MAEKDVINTLTPGLEAFAVRADAAQVAAVGAAGMQIQSDSIMQEPTPPLEEGTLRGSNSLHVGDEFVRTVDVPEDTEDADPNTDALADGHTEHQKVATVGFNTPYAARHHEIPADFVEPGSGNKYLETPMSENAAEYGKLMADTHKKVIDA